MTDVTEAIATGGHMPTAGGDRELYGIYRDYVKHENELIKNRLDWFIQLHSFLIASYVLAISSILGTYSADPRPPTVPPIFPQIVVCGVMYGITIVGLVSSLSARSSVNAANDAIAELSLRWSRLAAATPETWLPALTGGGSKRFSDKGQRLHHRLPMTLAVLWVCSTFVPLSFAYVGYRGASLCDDVPSRLCASYRRSLSGTTGVARP